jgi:Fur family transcriptional regulator, ferric uptake regulator
MTKTHTAQPRNTKQKDAIRLAFHTANRPLSPEEVMEAVREDACGISLATVYRNINAFVEDGWLTTVEIPGQSSRYEVAGKEHHHHFQCTVCGTLYELRGCVFHGKTKLPRGFLATGHEYFVYGICVDCRS